MTRPGGQAPAPPSPARALVIKLSALGDFILALGPMQAIRRAHPRARIDLLTTRPFRALAEASGLFDAILIDSRPRITQPRAILDLRRRLREGRYDFVYDLQTSDRTAFYYRLFWPDRPGWSGIAAGCSHPHANPKRDFMHSVDRQAEQLAMAGIDDVGPSDLSFLNADISIFALKAPFALIVPGGAPSRPEKRWGAENYAGLARLLAARGVTPVVLGTAAEAPEARAILAAEPRAVSLIGRTDLARIAALARQADAAFGNDTGPMHLIALTGCATTVVFSPASDPALSGPRGARVRIATTQASPEDLLV